MQKCKSEPNGNSRKTPEYNHQTSVLRTPRGRSQISALSRALKTCHHTFNKQVGTVWGSVTSESREMSAVEKSALGEFRQYWLWAPDWRVNPLSPNSDQHQFSPNNIHRLSRAKSRRINNWLQRYQSLIFYQTFSTNFLRKCKEISLGIFMWILGLKGLKAIPWNSGEFQSKPKICEQFDIFCGLTKSRKVFPPDPNYPGHQKKWL